MGDKKMSLSLNKNTVGWGCKVEALKDMGIGNSEYDALDAIVSELNENSGTFAGWSAISRELDKEAEELTDILEDKEGYLNE